MKPEDITVELHVVDGVSPVLKRISRRLWWMQYGGFVTSGLVVALVIAVAVAAFLLGRLSA